MDSEKNIIKRAIVEVYVSSSNDAFKVQNQASVFFKEKILPLIEKVVDSLNIPDQIIRIDKLELDFKKFDPDTSNDQNLLELGTQIREKLTKLIEQDSQDNFSSDAFSLVKKRPKKEGDEELFIHLLKTGTLPWWAKTEESLRLEILAEQILKQPSDSFKNELETALKLEVVRKRIAYKLNPTAIEKILKLINNKAEEFIRLINAIIEFVKKSELNNLDSFNGAIYEHALLYKSNSVSSLRLFISELLKAKRNFVFAENLYNACEEKSTDSFFIDFTTNIKNGLADVDNIFDGKIKNMFTVADVKQYFTISENKIETKKIVQNKKSDLSNENYSDDTILPEVTGDYFIKNAGLILISPFLSPFFKELGLLNGNEFLSPIAVQRAVYLVHYITHGDEAIFEEHEMVLNKIICGMRVEAPLTLEFIITEKEKEEAVNLLQAVADHWPALKGTSGIGMRDAFFTRDGILEKQSNGWNLKIEKTTIDILLDKLPWGISIVKMPWNDSMIFVDW